MRIRLAVVLVACLAAAGRAAAVEDGSGSPAPIADQPPCLGGGENGVTGCAQCSEPSYRFWADADYLLWWMKGAKLPPLVTTSPTGTPQAQAGVLGSPGTTVLFGGSRVNDDARSGGLITLGLWFDECRTCGLELDFFQLEGAGSGFSASSTGDPILARPFYDPVAGKPSSELIAFPGLVAGNLAVAASSTGLTGADALLRCNLCCGCDCCTSYRLDAVGGYRFLYLADRVGINEDLVSTNANNSNFIPVGTSIAVNDRFNTSNSFNGFDMGLRGELRKGNWVLSGRADVALGDNHELLNINGGTTVNVPGAPPPITSVGGLLALQNNIGHFTRDRFVAIPELGVKIGYQITPHIQLCAGYTFLYWGDVLRAGNAIDTVVNPNLLPPPVSPLTGPMRPEPRLDNTSMWTQGIDLGVQFRF